MPDRYLLKRTHAFCFVKLFLCTCLCDEPKQFETLKSHLQAFADIELESKDYELVAEYFNAARKKGVQGSNTDFLICAISSRREMPILTTDKDFTNFRSVFPVSLHVPRR